MAEETVLIIDDSKELRSLLEAILPLAGYQVRSAASGEEGLGLAQEVQPDVILIDLELPDMTGLRILEELNQRGFAIPTIMMTGYGSEGSAARALQLGVRDYLIKPFTTEEVLSSIERALSESRLRQEKEQQALLLGDYAQRFELLSAAAQSAAQTLAPEQMLNRLVEIALQATQAEVGLLLRREGSQGDLQVIAAQSNPPLEAPPRVVGPGDQRLAPVMTQGGAVRLWAEAEEGIEIQTGEQVRAVCQVPLYVQGRVCGLLTVDRRSKGSAFSEADEETLTILSSYATLVLERSG